MVEEIKKSLEGKKQELTEEQRKKKKRQERRKSRAEKKRERCLYVWLLHLRYLLNVLKLYKFFLFVNCGFARALPILEAIEDVCDQMLEYIPQDEDKKKFRSLYLYFYFLTSP